MADLQQWQENGWVDDYGRLARYAPKTTTPEKWDGPSWMAVENRQDAIRNLAAIRAKKAQPAVGRPAGPEFIGEQEHSWPGVADDFNVFRDIPFLRKGREQFEDSLRNPFGLAEKSRIEPYRQPAYTARQAGVRPVRPSMSQEEPVLPGQPDPFGEITPDEKPMSSAEMWRVMPKIRGGDLPLERLESLENRTASPYAPFYEEVYPEAGETIGQAAGPAGPTRMQPPLPHADKPLSQGGFPSGLLRHLLTPPPQDRPGY